jgi:oligopeptide transport system permease protein
VSGSRVAGLWLAGLVLGAVLGPLLAADPDRQDLARALEPPGRERLFGTDATGRDLLARTLVGTRISLAIGLAATAVSLAIGLAWGGVAGYAGGRVEAVLMGIVDVLQGLPYVVFVAALVAVLGRGTTNLFVAIGAVGWLTTARIVRAEVKALKGREFVLAARALGASPSWILARHVIPNALGPVVVYAALTVPAAIRQEAFLSFLGLGVEPPTASLGTLLAEGVESLTPLGVDWWLLAFPGGVLVTAMLALNVLADALRDRLDPRSGEGSARVEARGP